MNQFYASFFSKIFDGTEHSAPNAILIKEKLVSFQEMVDSYKRNTNIFKNLTFDKFPQPNFTSIQSLLQNELIYNFLRTKTINFYNLQQAYININFEEDTSILIFKQVLKEELIELLPIESAPSLKLKIPRIIDEFFDYWSILSKQEVDKVQFIQATKNTVHYILTEFDLLQNSSIVLNIDKYFDFILNSSQHVYKNIKPVINNEFADNIYIYNSLQPAFSDIETEYKKIQPATITLSSELSLSQLWEVGNEIVAISEYDDIKEILSKIKKGIDKLFIIVESLFKDNKHTIESIDVVHEMLTDWLTIPNDFRPENWVEVAHFIVKNIQNNLSEIANGRNADIINLVLPFVEKLEYILSTIDNDDFKLILAPKEQPHIHNIELPNLLEPEEKEKSVNDKVQNSILKSETAKLKDTTAETETDESEEEKPLTISAILEYLCFDKEFGAFNKLDDEHYAVIYDLYYKTWFSNRLDNIINDVQDLFTLETLKTIWEELKAMLLNENGVNLGELIDFLVEKGVAFINQLLDFAKETITYIMDELFMLVKAIIAFFQKVDLPPVARELLKKLPPFQNLSDEVTLLHILAAIPYTLYKEFVDFEMQSQTV